MDSVFDKKKKKEEPKSGAETITTAAGGVTAREKAAREGSAGTTAEDMVRSQAREKAQQATGAARLQESEANKGAYAGLGLADRAAAERMVRSGEAKTRDEAAGMIRKKRQPKSSASTQADALEK